MLQSINIKAFRLLHLTFLSVSRFKEILIFFFFCSPSKTISFYNFWGMFSLLSHRSCSLLFSTILKHSITSDLLFSFEGKEMKSVIFRNEFRLDTTDSFCFLSSLAFREFIYELALEEMRTIGWFYFSLLLWISACRSISLCSRALRGILEM